MLQLPLDCQDEQHDEVGQQEGPEDGQVQQLRKRAEVGHDDCQGDVLPKSKLRHAAQQRPRFVVVVVNGVGQFADQPRIFFVFFVDIRQAQGREELHCQVQKVEAQDLGDHVETPVGNHSEKIEQHQKEGDAPARAHVDYVLVHPVAVLHEESIDEALVEAVAAV